MALEWSQDYETGEATIDDQHKRLFIAVNDLEELVERQIHEGPELDWLMRFLATYVHNHFSYEELCMQHHKCPVAEKNHQAHQAFMAFYAEIAEEYNAHGSSIRLMRRLHTTLSDWLVSHICQVDIHLRACLHGSEK